MYTNVRWALIKNSISGEFIVPVFMIFFAGYFMAALQTVLLAKPFTFCLPGHRQVVRKIIFFTGLALSFAVSLLFLLYPLQDLYWLDWMAVICLALFAGLTFYWLGLLVSFVDRYSISLSFFLSLFSFGVYIFDLNIIIARIIFENPTVVILVGILGSLAAWIGLDYDGLARRYCGRPWMGFLDISTKEKIQKYTRAQMNIKQWDRLKKHPHPWVENFFLDRMNKCDYFSMKRYIWGGLYTTFGMILSLWKVVLLFLFIGLLILCFLSYIGPVTTSVLLGTGCFMIAFMIMIMPIRFPIYSIMPVSGGRNERFCTTLTLVATTTVVIIILATVIAALSMVLSAIMPYIPLRGRIYTFHVINIKLFLIPLLIIPIALTFRLIFYRKLTLLILSVLMLPTLLILLTLLLPETYLMLVSLLFPIETNSNEQWIATIINPVSVLCLFFLSWGIFVLVLRYICMKRCLVGQSRTY